MPSPRASDDVRRPHIRIYCQNTSRTEARLAEHSRSRDARRRATDAVADKARTAAIIDAYANQAARVGALLPFTSALAGLCAAAAAAAVEVAPIAAAVFPVLGAVCAAAASAARRRGNRTSPSRDAPRVPRERASGKNSARTSR